jgi:arylmalonate decarboxylase
VHGLAARAVATGASLLQRAKLQFVKLAPRPDAVKTSGASERQMPKSKVIGLVMPTAADEIPAEGPIMYPGVGFVSRGVHLRSLTPAGYDDAVARIVPAAEHLAALGADAIMVIGTSLTFYRGAEFNAELTEKIRAATGLPVSTMSTAIVEGLRAVGARRLAVATAYTGEVNDLLTAFLTQEGFEVRSLETFGSAKFVGEAARKTEQDILNLSVNAYETAAGADAVLIVCGGLRTLDITRSIEERCGVPVVSSMPAAFWCAMRLVGASGRIGGKQVGGGYGRLLEQSEFSTAEAQI